MVVLVVSLKMRVQGLVTLEELCPIPDPLPTSILWMTSNAALSMMT